MSRFINIPIFLLPHEDASYIKKKQIVTNKFHDARTVISRLKNKIYLGNLKNSLYHANVSYYFFIPFFYPRIIFIKIFF